MVEVVRGDHGRRVGQVITTLDDGALAKERGLAVRQDPSQTERDGRELLRQRLRGFQKDGVALDTMGDLRSAVTFDGMRLDYLISLALWGLDLADWIDEHGPK